MEITKEDTLSQFPKIHELSKIRNHLMQFAYFCPDKNLFLYYVEIEDFIDVVHEKIEHENTQVQ